MQAHAGQAPIKLVQFLSQPLERRGQLAGSIAHETRRSIAAAHTSANAGLRWLGRDHPDIKKSQESIARIIQDVTRGSEIISRNRILFKKGEQVRELVDVNEVIRDMVSLMSSEAIRRAISIHTSGKWFTEQCCPKQNMGLTRH